MFKDGNDGATNQLERVRGLLHYWFVQYNPLYFVSALCVLCGTFLVTNGLETIGWEQGQILLTIVIQTYEILLLIGTALLFRVAGQRRPAVILGIVEVFFLFDPTFQTMTIAHLGTTGFVMSTAWVVMVLVKLEILAWIFRLKTSPTALILPALAAVGVAGMPYALGYAGATNGTIHLIATWYVVGLVAVFLWTPPKITCAITLDAWGQTVFHRASKAAWMIWTGLYLYHLAAWMVEFSIPLTLPHAAPFLLLLPFVSKKENAVWAGCLGAVVVTSVEPFTVAPTALLVSLVFACHGWRTHRHRLLVGAVMSLYLAAWTHGWHSGLLPEPELWLNVTTAAVLFVMAWRLQLLSAALAAVVVMLPTWKNFVPQDTLEWGVLLLVIGFLALIVGVAIYWTQPQPRELDTS